MSPGEVATLITAIGGLIAVVTGQWLAIRKQSADLQAMKSQLGTVQLTATSAAADAKAVRVTTTTTNSGTHLLDKVNALGEAMARVEEQQAAQGSDIRGIRRDIGRLHDADREDRERAEAAHKDIWTAIKERRRIGGQRSPA